MTGAAQGPIVATRTGGGQRRTGRGEVNVKYKDAIDRFYA